MYCCYVCGYAHITIGTGKKELGLLHLNRSACFLQSLPNGFGFFLGNSGLYDTGSAIYEVLRFFQTEASDGFNFFYDLQFRCTS